MYTSFTTLPADENDQKFISPTWIYILCVYAAENTNIFREMRMRRPHSSRPTPLAVNPGKPQGGGQPRSLVG